MNSFANSLFSLLFSWARTMIQQIWASSISGRFSGFFVWLGDHWLWLAALVAIGGAVVDILVWFFRWQPYLVWQTRLRKLTRWLKGDTAPQRRFEKGYKRGVELIPPQDPSPLPPEEEEWQEPEWPEPPDPEFLTHSFTEALAHDDVDAVLNSAAQERQGRSRQDEEYEPPPLVTESWLSGAYNKKEIHVVQRRRRSERNEKKKQGWTSRLMIPEVEEDSLLDGLPPAVDRQQAFHAPVYPMQNNTGWQSPTPEKSTEENYRP